MWICKHCHKEFCFVKNTDKANHSRHCDKNPKKYDSYINGKIVSNRFHNQRLGMLKHFTVQCSTCSIITRYKNMEY